MAGVDGHSLKAAQEKGSTKGSTMMHSDSTAKLALALAKVQGSVRGAIKDSINPHFPSHYADLASVWDACRESLATHELAVVQSPSADGNLVRMTTLLLHSSGEWLESDPLQVQARDAAPQAIGSCITYLRRYQLAAIVGIAPEDDDAEAAEGRQVKSPSNVVELPNAWKPLVAPPTGADRIDPSPAGFHYIDTYAYKAPWHEITILGFDLQGGALKLSTKLTKVGEEARHAWESHTPVTVDYTPKAKYPGEGYLNAITTAPQAPVDASDISF